MFLELIKSPGLAQCSYLLGDGDAGECVVIDPRRDAEVYLDAARKQGCIITAALETHIHADFISGARELRKMTGCNYYAGASDEYGYEVQQLQDGDELTIGVLTLRAIHCPGHSPEHLCYLVAGGEGAEAPWGVFTGDTLFAGSIGRPDLASGLKPEELAAKLYHSLTEKLLPLGDGVIVYPGHGSGSPCGGSIGDRDQTTLGYEANHNPKLQAESEEDFVQKALDDLPDEPAYYPRLKKMNAQGATLHGGRPRLEPITIEKLKEISEKQQPQILDMREVTEFASAHVPGAINIALRSSFPPWAGRILSPDAPIYLVGNEPDELDEAHQHLYRMGFDNVQGYLNGGMRAWISQGEKIGQAGITSVTDLNQKLQSDNQGWQLLDVRSEGEWSNGHLPGAKHIFAAELQDRLDELDSNKPTLVYCGSDFRASLATSILAAHGFQDVSTLLGSIKAWKHAGLSLVA